MAVAPDLRLADGSVRFEDADDAQPKVAGRELGSEIDAVELAVRPASDDRFIGADMKHAPIDDMRLAADLERFGGDTSQRHVRSRSRAALIQIDQDVEFRGSDRPV